VSQFMRPFFKLRIVEKFIVVIDTTELD